MEGRWTILYDGRCRFCRAGAERLAQRVPNGKVELLSSHEPGALERFPGVTRERADAAMHLMDPTGRISVGAGAVARAIAARGGLWRLALGYFLPGVRWACDRAYALVAANRYRIGGRTGESCASGSCRR
jgi:predicted DCC family thiol-disulfide oxidoreductase YuxK